MRTLVVLFVVLCSFAANADCGEGCTNPCNVRDCKQGSAQIPAVGFDIQGVKPSFTCPPAKCGSACVSFPADADVVDMGYGLSNNPEGHSWWEYTGVKDSTNGSIRTICIGGSNQMGHKARNLYIRVWFNGRAPS